MKAVVLLSGGMDSTTLLHLAKRECEEVKALSFDYGQRHRKELESAVWQAQDVGVEHRIVDLTSLVPLLAGSALTDGAVDVPEGHYADETMKATVVPNRNMLMASIAAAWAVSSGFNAIAMAVHAGDHAIYPDCRPEFVEALAAVLEVANYESIDVWTPFLYASKGDIAHTGIELGVDFDRTWTCYKGLDEPCGKCGSCVERAEALGFATS